MSQNESKRRADDAPASSMAGEFDRIPETLDTLDGPQGHIAIIDSDDGALAVTRQILESDGHVVTTFNDAEAAFAHIGNRPPDVVVVDPFASGFPGLVLLERIPRSSPRGPEIVIATARDDVDTAVASLHRGAIDYIVKPLNSDRLRLAVVRALEQRRLVEENLRLKRDLALFAAGQRLLETLDGEVLATRGIEALMTFTQANAVALLSTTDHRLEGQRGLSPDEAAQVASSDIPLHWETRFSPTDASPLLARFNDGYMLDLGEQRRVMLFRMHGQFTPSEEDDALFLGRHLATALKNVLRYSSAERRARRDPLTGLSNARAFEEAVHHAVVRSSVDGSCFAVLFLDIDHFKKVNDVHGHLMGSRLLVELGQVISRALREGALIGRYGGDEFVVLLPGANSDAAKSIGERLRLTVAEHPFLTREGLGLQVTTCVGIACYPHHARQAHALLDMADRAMYLGKNAARNAVHMAGTLDERQDA